MGERQKASIVNNVKFLTIETKKSLASSQKYNQYKDLLNQCPGELIHCWRLKEVQLIIFFFIINLILAKTFTTIWFELGMTFIYSSEFFSEIKLLYVN